MANATDLKLTMSPGLVSPPRTPTRSPKNQQKTPSPTDSDFDFASRPPLRTPFAHIYRVISKPPSGPTAHRNSLYVNSPSPPTPTDPKEIHPAFRRKTPRHVPIVITKELVNRVVERKSFKQRLLEQNKAVQKRLFSSSSNKGQPEPLSEPLPVAPARPRDVPTVLPHFAVQLNRPRPDLSPPLSVGTGDGFASFGNNPFACRVGTAPPTPTDSQGSTPRASVVNIRRPSTPPSVMSRPTTGHGPGPSLDGANSGGQYRYDTEKIPVSMSNSQLSFTSDAGRGDESREGDLASPPASARTVTSTDPRTPSSATSNNFSGLTCNVHRCTGKEPRGLVGATTTILGDKLYVFGGRSLSRRRPHMTADLYELDLIHRHWSKIKTSGQTPSPRYFHSVCALGDSKLICYGGMSPAPTNPAGPQSTPNAEQPDVVVMSDVHIYDTKTRVWTKIETQDTPQGRYAHCAAVLPSTAVFSSPNAPLSAIHHNPSEGDNPNAGQLGIALDGTGGAEMVVVGGQDNANHYIEQISVFNLRSLKWTATNSLGRSCGAYRSVVAPLVGFPASKIGAGVDAARNAHKEGMIAPDGNSMLIYSNYNFLDVKLELQCRTQDGRLEEKPMGGPFSPPGLRFPNGGVLNNHFVISGTYLTSSRQEYALWALDLRTQTWSRIDVGGSVFGQGSWNRGVLWPRRNTFVILGNRKRNLVDDYNHRRINFTNICLVELEAFGLYDNPRLASPTSAYQSYSAPELPTSLRPKASLWSGGGRPHFTAAEELGKMALNLRELSDMDILTLNGEKVPANSHVLARRWGAFFVKTMREGANGSGAAAARSLDGMSPTADDKDANTIRNAAGYRNSSVTITPSIATAYTTSTNLTVGSAGSTGTATLGNGSISHASSNSITSGATTLTNGTANGTSDETGGKPFHAPSPATLPASSRSRTLYLPHTAPTVHALLHYLYTNTLPPAGHALSTPQILCSLLQLARPYRIDGLLEAVLQRLHQVMDGRSAAAVFNACAMAAGGGRGTGFDKLFDGAGNLTISADDLDANGDLPNGSGANGANSNKFATGAAAARARQSMANGRGRGAMERKNTFDVGDGQAGDDARRNGSTASTSSMASQRGRSDSTDASEDDEAGTSGTDTEGGSMTDSSDMWDDPIGGVPGPGTTNAGVEEEVWTGDRSCVIGLQKRGLRGLMEGRRMRERGESAAASSVKGSLR